MKHTKLEQQPVVSSFTCDRCGLHANADESEFFEAHHIDFTGGYGSVFGDGNRVQCDLCQKCLHQLISSCFRVTEPATPTMQAGTSRRAS